MNNNWSLNKFNPPASASGLDRLWSAVFGLVAPPPRYHGNCAAVDCGDPDRDRKASEASCHRRHRSTNPRGSASCHTNNRRQIFPTELVTINNIKIVYYYYYLNCFLKKIKIKGFPLSLPSRVFFFYKDGFWGGGLHYLENFSTFTCFKNILSCLFPNLNFYPLTLWTEILQIFDIWSLKYSIWMNIWHLGPPEVLMEQVTGRAHPGLPLVLHMWFISEHLRF